MCALVIRYSMYNYNALRLPYSVSTSQMTPWQTVVASWLPDYIATALLNVRCEHPYPLRDSPLIALFSFSIMSDTNTASPATGITPSSVSGDVEKLPQAKLQLDEAEGNFKPKTLKFWAVIVSIFLALFLVAIDRTIVGTASPQITVDFKSLGDIGWYGSAYQLTTSACQLVFGRVYRFHDTKK